MFGKMREFVFIVLDETDDLIMLKVPFGPRLPRHPPGDEQNRTPITTEAATRALHETLGGRRPRTYGGGAVFRSFY